MLHGTLRMNGADTPATMENIEAALAGKDFFWLDLDDDAEDGDVIALLTDQFKFHPLAVQSAERFNQRPRIDDLRRLRRTSSAAAPTPSSRARPRCTASGRTATR